MPTRRILLTLDGSTLAEAAFAPALELAAAFDAELHMLAVVHVDPYAPPPSQVYGVGGYLWAPPPTGERPLSLEERIRLEKEKAHGYLERLAASAARPVVIHVTDGDDAAKEILRYAENYGITHIVMATHGRHGLSRFVHGSVAGSVVAHANVPVTVVRPREVRE
jgi:nucleotide-binding universal stress UspA family protein